MSTIIAKNNKRIAKNTLMLYVRMFFTLIIGLITSRVILKILGVEDFGIYNVVGSVVSAITFINTSLSVSTQRYLTIELGKNDFKKYQEVFSSCLNIFIAFSLILIFIGETIGLYFINKYLNIPADRISAANWVYQTSLLACAISLFNIPYNASIIAHEKMDAFAYISIGDTILRILIVFLLVFFQYDRLKTYGILMFFVSVLLFIAYYLYCRKYFKECKYKLSYNKILIKELLYYSGWNLFGSLAMMAKGQGLNILLNIFFNPTVNAARGIAYQVNGLVNQFFSSFYSAVQPQITKSYAQRDFNHMYNIVLVSSRLSYYLILIISLPIIFQTEFIINLWLGQNIDYVVPFIRIVIIISAIDSMSNPIMTSIQATGKIRNYQVTIGIIILMNIPVSWFFLKNGSEPNIVFIVSLIISIIALIIRLIFLQVQLKFSIKTFLKEVIVKIIFVTVISLSLSYFIYIIIPECNNLKTVILQFILIIISTLSVIIGIGLKKNERKVLLKYIKRIKKQHRQGDC